MPKLPFQILAHLPGIDAKFKMLLVSSTAVHECTYSHWWCYLLGCSATLLNSWITLTVPAGRILAVHVHSSCVNVTRGCPRPGNMQFYVTNPSRAELQPCGTSLVYLARLLATLVSCWIQRGWEVHSACVKYLCFYSVINTRKKELGKGSVEEAVSPAFLDLTLFSITLALSS